jgi:hypothetical protein
VLLGLAALVGGCGSPAHSVKVDASSRPVRAEAQSYVLRFKDPTKGDESLRHREAADFIRTALAGKGLDEASLPERADMVVEFDYGMEAPRSKIERVSVPVYAQVWGGVRYETVQSTDSRGNSTLRTVAVHQPPRNQIVGYEQVPRRVTVYAKYLRLSARENRAASEGRPPAELWSIHASTEDESKDLRKYLPILASATVDYIGSDTSSQRTVKVRADGAEVDFIRRRGAEPAPAPANAGRGS